MPYIKQEDRDSLDKQIFDLRAAIRNSPNDDKDGLLNYSISCLLDEVYSLKQPTYKKLNAAIGVLGCVTQELYRRRAIPYEDQKIIENGDVF